MLAGRGPGDIRAIDAIRKQFARARLHETAMAGALREALAAVFEKLDPEALEEQLGRRAQGVAGADLKARLWNRYLELFRATVQSGDAGLPAAFLVAFARAHGNQDGQVFALVVMVVAACEVAVGLGLIVAIYRRRLPIDVDELRELQG